MLWLAFFLLVVVAALLVIVWPLRKPRVPWQALRTPAALNSLLLEKERLLRLLKDLDMERDAGTLGEAQYEELRRAYRIEAALAERRYQELGAETRSETGAPTGGAGEAGE